MSAAWVDDLGDRELIVRLTQRGMRDDEATVLVWRRSHGSMRDRARANIADILNGRPWVNGLRPGGRR